MNQQKTVVGETMNRGRLQSLLAAWLGGENLVDRAYYGGTLTLDDVQNHRALRADLRKILEEQRLQDEARAPLRTLSGDALDFTSAPPLPDGTLPEDKKEALLVGTTLGATQVDALRRARIALQRRAAEPPTELDIHRGFVNDVRDALAELTRALETGCVLREDVDSGT